MECAVGVDVGHSAGSHATTGIVVLECATLQVRVAEPVTAHSVRAETLASLRDQDHISVAVIDGPLAPPHLLPKQRLCEQFFSTGVFASTGSLSRGLRLQPAPTREGSPFLSAATEVAAMLVAPPLNVPAFNLQLPIQPSVAEIFPTLFMAALLPPQCYDGGRSTHTDDLWVTLMGCDGGKPLPLLRPYERLRQAAESQRSSAAKHEVRAAAICAIAAHAIASGVPLGFLGTAAEQGFLLPGTRCRKGWMNAEFHQLMEEAWDRRPDTQQDLQWL